MRKILAVLVDGAELFNCVLDPKVPTYLLPHCHGPPGLALFTINEFDSSTTLKWEYL